MNLDNEILEEVTRAAENGFSVEEIAIYLGENPMEFELEFLRERELHQAVQKGRLKTKAALNASIISSAKQGSHPAQGMAKKIINKAKGQDNG